MAALRKIKFTYFVYRRLFVILVVGNLTISILFFPFTLLLFESFGFSPFGASILKPNLEVNAV